MNYTELYENIRCKGSFLCVGLDTDPAKIPACVRERHGDASMLAFNKAVIDATAPYAVAYKPNIAFYEAEGVSGWQQLAETVRYIRSTYPDIFIIADAKRGDIGNTADRYARAFFETMDFDAVTLAPYMGSDSIRPFLKREGRWGIVLAMTSNKSAEEFETLTVCSASGHSHPDTAPMPLYERIIRDTVSSVDSEFGDSRSRLMFVVGATRPEKLAEIRRYCPDAETGTPAPSTLRSFPSAEFTESAELFDQLPALSRPIESTTPEPMEQFGQNFGFILYRTTLHFPEEYAPLSLRNLADNAWIFVNGKCYGKIDCNREESVLIPPGRVDILVENQGRINAGMGRAEHWNKGITGALTIGMLTGRLL